MNVAALIINVVAAVSSGNVPLNAVQVNKLYLSQKLKRNLNYLNKAQ